MPLCPLGFLELCRALSRSPRETNARYSGTLPSRVDANKRDRRGPQNSKAALLLFLFLNAQPIYTRVEAREKNCPSRLNEGERDEKRAPFSISQKSPSFACEQSTSYYYRNAPKVDSFPFPSRESEERYNKLVRKFMSRKRKVIQKMKRKEIL